MISDPISNSTTINWNEQLSFIKCLISGRVADCLRLGLVTRGDHFCVILLFLSNDAENAHRVLGAQQATNDRHNKPVKREEKSDLTYIHSFVSLLIRNSFFFNENLKVDRPSSPRLMLSLVELSHLMNLFYTSKVNNAEEMRAIWSSKSFPVALRLIRLPKPQYFTLRKALNAFN